MLVNLVNLSVRRLAAMPSRLSSAAKVEPGRCQAVPSTAHRFSGGQLKRLCIAWALDLKPSFILLGVGLVNAFTLGLAPVLVAVRLIAALGLRLSAAGGSRRIDLLLRQAPLASGSPCWAS